METAAIIKVKENLAVLPASTVRFIKLATGASRVEVRSLLVNGEHIEITQSQLHKINDIFGSGEMNPITVKKCNL